MSSTRKHLSPETLLGALEGLGEVAPATLYAGFPGFTPRTMRRAMAEAGEERRGGRERRGYRPYQNVPRGRSGGAEPATGMSTDDASGSRSLRLAGGEEPETHVRE